MLVLTLGPNSVHEKSSEPVGTSPLPVPKSVFVWYLGVPSSSNAPIENTNGAAPTPVSG